MALHQFQGSNSNKGMEEAVGTNQDRAMEDKCQDQENLDSRVGYNNQMCGEEKKVANNDRRGKRLLILVSYSHL